MDGSNIKRTVLQKRRKFTVENLWLVEVSCLLLLGLVWLCTRVPGEDKIRGLLRGTFGL